MATRQFTLRSVLAASLAIFASAMAGCLERFESITIKPDGGAVLRSEFRGTAEDFKKPADALPEKGGAWAISQREEKDADGKPRVVRVAELVVAPGAALPGTYAAAGDARAASALKFPTTLNVTRVGPNTYYEFTRTYARREEANYAYLKKQLTENDAFKAIDGKDPSALTDEQRALLLRTFARLEADKITHYIEAGAAAMEADGTWGQEIGLLLRNAAIDYAQRFDLKEADALLKTADDGQREAKLTAMGAAFTDGLHSAIHNMLAKLNVPEDQQKRFIDATLAEKALRTATEDLSDERWEVRVTMPGMLSAHNADRVENGVLVWEFKADAIMDRDQVLRATSFAPTAK